MEYIYLACAFAGAIIFLVRIVLMSVGGFDGDTDKELDADGADFDGVSMEELDLAEQQRLRAEQIVQQEIERQRLKFL